MERAAAAAETTSAAGELVPATEQDRLVALRERLHHAGQRLTPQRALILAAFDPGQHLTAEAVYDHVASRLPGVNRATVYRTLERFRDIGLISETDLGDGVRHFELLGESRHHHLICQGCGRLLVLDDELVAPLREQITARYGFVACIDHLALFGRCVACRGVDAAETGTARE